MENAESIVLLIEKSIRDNWQYAALSDINSVGYHYRDVARKIAKLHLLFEATGVKRGDKVAICGKNSSQWAIAFLSIFTYGAVAVPILHEFKPDNIHHLVTHSDSKLFFVDSSIWDKLDPEYLPTIDGAVLISDYSVLFSRSEELDHARQNLNRLFGERYPERFGPEDVKYEIPNADTLAIINYTSGSTGFSKGVMLSYKNIWSNIRFGLDNIPYLGAGDGVICMLPLAHMFGLVIELVHLFVQGCHIHFLGRIPSPRVLLDAFAMVKPKLIITVPLVIEKIIKTKVFPLIDKPLMKLLLHVPFVDDKVLGKIYDNLIAAFGGNLQQLIIGGAGLNVDVETFLRRIKFPFTVGYGMTECAPLICYAPWEEQRQGACGRIVDRMEGRINSPDPINVPGVLFVRGDNVMLGYYKNPEATSAALQEGWLDTGDICQIDEDGFLYIRGRDKSMILGPSGQNIYPEEIEQKINNLPYVSESLVVDRSGKLTALVYPDFEGALQDGITETVLEGQIEGSVKSLNGELPAYSQISNVVVFHEEFEKTPKRSIKRYLYQN